MAHPDDEVLWAGGLLLAHPECRWLIATLCRANDADRAPRFFKVAEHFGAEGAMADLDDGPEQTPLPRADVAETILSLLPESPAFDLVVTHGPLGEYTRHRRHEETCRAVAALWAEGRIATRELWLFAYEDGGRAYMPRVAEEADRREVLTDDVWREKHRIMTELYGFGEMSWEARCTPREEGFRCFGDPRAALDWINARRFEEP